MATIPNLPELNPEQVPYQLQEWVRRVQGLIGIGGVRSDTVLGTTTGTDAPAGYLGEYKESIIASGSAVTVAANFAGNITSLSLTAGDWDVEGVSRTGFAGPGGAGVPTVTTGLSTTSATIVVEAYSTVTFPYVSTGTTVSGNTTVTPKVRFALNVTTTIYLVSSVSNTASANWTGYGDLRARRVR